MTKEQIKVMLDRILTWSPEAQEEAVASLQTIEEEFMSSHELSSEDVQAIERSAEDVRHGRFATDEDVKRVFGRYQRKCGQAMTKEQIDAVLEGVRSWPEEDQEELIEIAREIEARRTGVYVLSDDERAAIQKSRSGPLASDEEVEAFWNRHDIA
jgi:hypothetical protein